MLRLLIISVLLVAVNTEYTVDEFLGDWLPVATYPKSEVARPYCHWFSFKSENNLKCTCGDQETPVIKIGNNDEQITKTLPVVFIDETEDADSKIKKCICMGTHLYTMVLKKIDANYVIGYGAESRGDSVHSFAVVFVRKVPSLAELQAVLNRVPDLRDKEPLYMCPSSYVA